MAATTACDRCYSAFQVLHCCIGESYCCLNTCPVPSLSCARDNSIAVRIINCAISHIPICPRGCCKDFRLCAEIQIAIANIEFLNLPQKQHAEMTLVKKTDFHKTS